MDTRKNNVTHHIAQIELEQTDIVDRVSGLKKIIIWGWIIPHGDKKQILIDSLENPNMSTSFSMRSMVREVTRGMRKVRQVAILITWDFVSQPGIKGSSDWGTMGYECDKSVIERALKHFEENKVGNESKVSLLCDISAGMDRDNHNHSPMRDGV
jgi:hypothetical protein